MKNILGKVGLMAFICVVMGVCAYRAGKNKSQNQSVTPTESVSAHNDTESQGKTLYVSPDGNDTNPGTKDSPKKTIGAAVNAADTTGDKIVTKPKSTSRTSSG